MKRNVGDLDSKVRSRLGMILILVGILGFFNLVEIGLTVRVVLLAGGVVLLATGSFKTCGIYSVFGIDTTGEKEAQE